jgi:tetratricopeptide (TPR) repeat protein
VKRVGEAAALVVVLVVSIQGCGAPPWQMGAPLNGRPSIPPTTARRSPEEARRAADGARASGAAVLELAALSELASSGRLRAGEQRRMVDLLYTRAQAFRVSGRAIPWSRDLEQVARLDPATAAPLGPERAAAAAAAGDAWKAIGARREANAAFSLATSLGGAPPASARRRAAPAPLDVPHPMKVDINAWLTTGPALSLRLTALVAAHPWVLNDVPRALFWVEAALDEDPGSPDVLEVAALTFGRARRFGGTQRMLMEMTYYSPDRAAALARGAAVWERLGRPREACAEWIRAARWRDDAEDPTWRQAIDCARADPGAGDWKEIRAYVLERARPERRDALAASLDAPVGSAVDGSAPVTSPPPDGAPAGEPPADAGAR